MAIKQSVGKEVVLKREFKTRGRSFTQGVVGGLGCNKKNRYLLVSAAPFCACIRATVIIVSMCCVGDPCQWTDNSWQLKTFHCMRKDYREGRKSSL